MNRLAHETSPYLLQHASNPVDWFPWGEEALEQAKSGDKPILLSIGYSACHWCHVMAHESFEDPEIASLMNQNFINIKVDREERPDLDHVYMEAVQTLTQRGGWPLTLFLTPDLKPFYGGTYFPPEDRPGMPGFSRVLRAVSEAYISRRSDVENTARQIRDALESEIKKEPAGSENLTELTLKEAYLILQNQFDSKNGGFGEAPKFPNPLALEYLLRYFSRFGDTASLKMVELTLDKMAKGGIYDQIGGGFHRYSTDDAWQIPHFEKMLYDNALLSRVYLHSYQVTRNKLYADIAQETLDYVLREMASYDGGFFSTQDADSEGTEGKYYLWAEKEINDVLGKETGQKTGYFFGVSPEGNFEGLNILHRIEDQSASEIVRGAKAALFNEREKRIKPSRDEKILASWNGMFLTALSEGASILNSQDYKQAAVKCGLFLLDKMLVDGKIRHVYKSGKVKMQSFLEDYAHVVEGLLALHCATLEGKWLSAAVKLASDMVVMFSNPLTGLLSDTVSSVQDLIIRPRNEYDGAVPSACATAAMVLQKIGLITGNPDYAQITGRELGSVKSSLNRYPLGFCQWLSDLDFYLSDLKEIVISGPRNDSMTLEFMRTLNSKWIPNKVLIGFDPADSEAFQASPLLTGRTMKDDQPAVFICQNNICQALITDAIMLEKKLE